MGNALGEARGEPQTRSTGPRTDRGKASSAGAALAARTHPAQRGAHPRLDRVGVPKQLRSARTDGQEQAGGGATALRQRKWHEPGRAGGRALKHRSLGSGFRISELRPIGPRRAAQGALIRSGGAVHSTATDATWERAADSAPVESRLRRGYAHRELLELPLEPREGVPLPIQLRLAPARRVQHPRRRLEFVEIPRGAPGARVFSQA